jgi:AraC-like DNA-binding protein
MICNMQPGLAHVSSKGALLGSDDLIAETVGLLRPQTVVEPRLHAGGSWAVQFDPFPHVKLGTVVSGECWLALEGHDPVQLREGDFYLLGNPPHYILGSDLDTDPVQADSLWSGVADHSAPLGDATADTYLCGGHFFFDDSNAPILIDILPTLVHVRAGDPRGGLLAHLSELLVTEVESSDAGGVLVLDALAQVLFVHMLRAHADQEDRPTGWLGALKQDDVGAALRAMHADVARRWSLGELATISHMSRSAFAAAFKAQVGRPPLDYLIQWRMSLARDALRQGSQSITELAAITGYESESAFSTAFRRVVGCSPKQYRDAHRGLVEPVD